MYTYDSRETKRVIGRNRVVITGLGVLAANGIGKEAFWNSLLAGESGIGPITQFDASDLPCKIAGEIKGFDPLNYMESALKPRRMGRFSQLAIAATQEALKDANLEMTQVQKKRDLAIIMGVATSDIDLVVDPPKIHSTPSLVPHAAATAISRFLGIRCQLFTLSNACTSGLDAIAKGAELIRNGYTDMVIAGSSEASVTFTTMNSLSKGGMLPVDFNDRPSIASCPFSLDRSGGILAEAAGIVILESLDHARERCSPIYSEVLGHGSWIHPNIREDGYALNYAMTTSLANSAVLPTDIDYINAHAPSDPILDRVESEGIKSVFGKRAYSIPTSSIKAVTGNPFACGGALQTIATALAFETGILPPTSNLNKTDLYCDLDYIPNNPINFDTQLAMVNSRGIGGGNSSLILSRVHQ